ncbi:hypothetical protein CRUP_004211 [Coryphaenoides rupestris]|nr:hypothetical protein CRUP_004211 [Coryphaenoides rupestris]
MQHDSIIESSNPDYVLVEAEANRAGGSGSVPTPPPATEHDELLVDLRNFVAFQARVDGEASTAEVLATSRRGLASSRRPVFRELLRSICDFHRAAAGQEGMWRLKESYR